MSTVRYHMESHADAVGRTPRLLFVSLSKYTGDWPSMLHSHAFTELFFCLHGKGQFRIGEQAFPVCENDMIFINPSVEHTEFSLDDQPLEYIVLGVEGITFHNRLPQADVEQKISVSNAGAEIRAHFSALLDELRDKHSNYEEIAYHLLQIIILKTLRYTDSYEMVLAPVRSLNRECERVRQYLDEQYWQPIDLDKLSEVAHVNKFYLAHTFQKEYGVSPIRYLVERRVREARYLLEHTNYSLSQISSQLGFSSLSYFSQTFRKIVGHSPNDFRKNAKALRGGR